MTVKKRSLLAMLRGVFVATTTSFVMGCGGRATAPVAAPSPTAGHLECKSDDAKDCEVQCNEGSADSCSNLGALYREGKVVAKDLARAVTLFNKACDGGSPRGCFRLASAYEPPPLPWTVFYAASRLDFNINSNSIGLT